MSEIPRIRFASPVISGVLKVVWDDGYEGIVDLRPILSQGKVFAFLNDPDRFRQLEIGDHGSSVFWLDPQGRTIDFGTLSLRERAEAQADLIRVAI